MAESDHWRGQLIWRPGRLIYLGHGGPADAHRHHAVQLIASIDEPIPLEIEGRAARVRAAAIPSLARHAVDTTGRRIAMVLAEPHGPAGAALARNAIRLAGRDLGPAVNLDSGQPRQHGAGTLSLPILAHRLVAAADPAPFETGPVSTPVAAALTYLDGALGGHPRLTEAARLAAVSPSRLTHLFSEEIGIPFRRYVLWLRLRRAAEAASSAATLTDAAMVAGFADLPHLSRVCRSMFGVNPSVVQNMQFIPTTG